MRSLMSHVAFVASLLLIGCASAGGDPGDPTSSHDVSAAFDDRATSPDELIELPGGTGCTPCVPACEGKECGDDGCGGLCGQCTWDGPFYCAGSSCAWADWGYCNGRNCGDDGMGGSCGACPEGWECRADGVCEPSAGGCAGIPEGGLCMNGAVVTCVDGAAQAQPCAFRNCRILEGPKTAICDLPCLPNCFGRECGRDGCNGSCGECDAGWTCLSGVCVPVAGCGPFDERTVCRGHVAVACRYGSVEATDCLASMQVCGLDPCTQEERCHPVWPGQPCDNLPTSGICLGTSYLSCSAGHLRLQRCDASQGFTCHRHSLTKYGCQ